MIECGNCGELITKPDDHAPDCTEYAPVVHEVIDLRLTREQAVFLLVTLLLDVLRLSFAALPGFNGSRIFTSTQETGARQVAVYYTESV